MSIEIVFETHALSEDNERGIATGWLPGRLSDRGRDLAADMGPPRRDDRPAAGLTSALRRAARADRLRRHRHPDPPRLAPSRMRLRPAQRHTRPRHPRRPGTLPRPPLS